MPLFTMIHGAAAMGLVDGPTEVHKVTVARQVLRDYQATEGMWPSEWIPKKIEDAKAKFAQYIELEVGNL
jgi:acyl-CoA dehydrogenase